MNDGVVTVEVADELADDGLSASFVGTSATVKPIVYVFQQERYGLKIRVTAGNKRVDRLSYTIFGASDEKLSQGTITLEPLRPGESGEGEIIDREVPNTRRLVISN
jgi:hypothetical protein